LKQSDFLPKKSQQEERFNFRFVFRMLVFECSQICVFNVNFGCFVGIFCCIESLFGTSEQWDWSDEEI
jgi:hypothetical protein